MLERYILLVENDRQNAELVCEALDINPDDALIAHSYEEGRGLATKYAGEIRAGIFDLHLSSRRVGEGLTLAKEIHASSQPFPILALTADTTVDVRFPQARTIFTDIVQKPYPLAALDAGYAKVLETQS